MGCTGFSSILPAVLLALRDRCHRKTSLGKGMERSQQGQVAPHFIPKIKISLRASEKLCSD